MGFLSKTTVLLGLLSSAVLAAPAPQVGTTPTAADPNACGVVSQAFTQQRAADPKAIARVSAAQAIACLRSVPNKPEPAMKLVQSFKAFAQWESTLTYLKNPPAGYGLPAVDIEGGLDAIMANVSAGGFTNEYDFQTSVVKLVAQAHDGHFAYRPDVFKAFSFRNDLVADLASLSVDGKQVPKLYNFALVNGTKTSIGNVTMPLDANGLPPAVSKINGRPAAEVIEADGLALVNSQDQDSQWNAQFSIYSAPAGQPVISASIIYAGDSVTLEYENGQTISQDSYALIRPTADFSNIATGEDFYQRFCNPANVAPTNGTATQQQPQPQPSVVPGTLQPPAPALPGFPMPAVRDSGANATAGYFLSGTGYDDVAVLSVLGFAPEGDFDVIEYVVNFQKVVETFLTMSRDAGKKRLVIDVSSNGGGLVVAGYELYSQIFPGNAIFQANNLRRSESLVQIATIAGANVDKINALNLESIDPRNASTETLALAALANNEIIGNLIPGDVFSAGDKVNYTSTEQIIAPVELAGDMFTAYQSTPQNETDPVFNLTGTGTRSNPLPAVFAPENVVILTDGTCGSTCTLFSYLMIMQQNIKTVTVGGRPQTGPMQSMGGVEGAQVFDLESIQQAAAAAFFLATPEQKAQLNGTELTVLAEGYALDRAATAGSAGAVNGKNAFSHMDTTTPLQFLNQPSQCRFFYTKEMIRGPEATWKRAVDAAFNDPNQFCVEGSQMPLMGVQAPSDAFFTGNADGGGTFLEVNGGVRRGGSMAVVMGAAALVGTALML